MTDDRSLERAARSFIEPGPARAPEAAIEAALRTIQTTPQERDWHVPRRNRSMTMTTRLLAAVIALAVVAVGGVLVLRPGNGSVGGPSPSLTLPSRPPSAIPSTAVGASPTLPNSAPALDYSTLPGRILIEHLGNAPDGSEPANGDYHTERRRFYWMDPKTMTGASAVEFLPGQPAAGKLAGDVSADQTKIVFQDNGNGNGEFIWTANLDGTGLKKLATSCNTARAACGNWEPAFDPTGRRVVFVRVQGDASVLDILDLATGVETPLLSTEGASSNDVAEQPAWSPDGSKIAFGRVHYSGQDPAKATISIVDLATDRTTVLPIALKFPGDPHWSPDGSRILVTDGPVSMASVPLGQSVGRTAEAYSVAADGTDVRQITHSSGNVITANFTPDGHVLYFNNYFWLVGFDGSDPRPVNVRGDDLSEMNVGFAYSGHWITKP